MSLDGTWADNVIIQAVADSLNLQIRIVESNDLFAPLTHIEPVFSQQEPSPVFFLGHIDEIHYVYSLPLEDLEETIGLNSRLSSKQKDPFNCAPPSLNKNIGEIIYKTLLAEKLLNAVFLLKKQAKKQKASKPEDLQSVGRLFNYFDEEKDISESKSNAP